MILLDVPSVKEDLKYVQISHEKANLYCHYFNNKKNCPYESESVFLHEHSKPCKYGVICERDMCLFKHEHKDNEDIDNIDWDLDVNKFEHEKSMTDDNVNVDDPSMIIDVNEAE